MGEATRKNLNELLAPKKIKKSLTLIGRLLVLVGKPFYRFLTWSLIATLFFLNITGYFTRVVVTNFSRFLLAFFYLLFINLPGKIASFLVKRAPKIKKLINLALAKLNSARKKAAKVPNLISKRASLLFKTVVSLFGKFLRNIATGLGRLKRVTKLKLVILSLLIFVVALIPPAYFLWRLIIKDLPSPRELTSRNLAASTKIYDRNGILLYKIFENQNRTPVKLAQIPLHVKLATLAIEDAEFYSHPGFSLRGIFRAIIKIARSGEITGGSTITQQLIKNTLLSPEKTLVRKLKEVILAIQVEKVFSKDEILEMYLNEVSYGGTAYGIQEASRVYFDKDVDKLSLAEAALLAGLPKSPTQYSPFGSHPELAFEREGEVLHLMKVNGFINEEQENSVLSEKITFAPNRTDIKAPHFVMYVRGILEQKYTKEVIEKGGLEVVTTLDYQIQKLAERVVAEEVGKLSSLNVKNGAALVLNPTTGEILAMVGSKDYFDIENDGNVNVVTSLRQPGSSIKIVNYAYALSHEYTPATIIADTPMTFIIPGQPPYTPKNYEGGFRGNLTLRSALAESRNVAAVKVLASYGVEKMVDQGKKLGISSWENPQNYGLSLTLGGGEVRLIDLARVYATVANYGKRPEIISTLKVSNDKGEILEKFDCKQEDTKQLDCAGEQVLDPRIAYLLIDILSDNNARAPAFGSNSMLVIPNHQEIAVKTGTSNDLRDNLTVGFNQKYLVAVWVGNNDNSPMARIASGVTGAAPIFNKIMSALLAPEENQDWPIPEGLVHLPICRLTGTLSCEGCPTKIEWFLQENAPTKACNPEYIKELIKTKESNGEILEPAAQTQSGN